MSSSPVNAQVEHHLLMIIIQLIVIIAASRFFSDLFRRFGQPKVCGEIAAGLILGPSLLGNLFPGMFTTVFNPSVGSTMSLISQLGLVFLMFLIGLEFDFGLLAGNGRTALSVSAAGILLPFTLGFGLGQIMHGQMQLSGSAFNFSLFMATAMSICSC